MNDTSKDTLDAIYRLIEEGALDFPTIRDKYCKIDEKILSALITDNLISPKVAANTTQQGDALEEIARYLIDNCGLFDRTDHNRKNSQHEIDHWGEFKFPISKKLNDLGIKNCQLFGESKNYLNRAIKVDVVYKVESLKLLLGAGVGAYFTRNGVTGSDELHAGRAVMKDFHQRFWSTDASLSVVLTNKDWLFLKDNPKKFNALFFEKLSLFKTTYGSDLSDDDYAKLA